MTICKACLKTVRVLCFWFFFFNVKSKWRSPRPLLQFSALWIQNFLEVSDTRILVMCQAILFFHLEGSCLPHMQPHTPTSLDLFLRLLFSFPGCAALLALFAFVKERITLQASFVFLIVLRSPHPLGISLFTFFLSILNHVMSCFREAESLHFLSGQVPLCPISGCLISLDPPPRESAAFKVVIKTQRSFVF